MIDTLHVWWTNICLWYTENEQAITTFFMSGQFISLIAALTMLVKNIKQVKSNTASTKTLDATLVNTNAMSEDIKSLNNSVLILTEENQGLREELNDVQKSLSESNRLITDKLNAIIEVQSIVYTTIRDDSVRQTVNTILNNARYSEQNFKEQLETEIEALKVEFENKMSDMSKSMTEAVTHVANSVNAGENARNRAKRLKGIDDEPTRY